MWGLTAPKKHVCSFCWAPYKSSCQGRVQQRTATQHPTRTRAFHPAICVCGSVGVFYLFIKNIQQSTPKCSPWSDDWCCFSAGRCFTFKLLHTFTPGNYQLKPLFFFYWGALLEQLETKFALESSLGFFPHGLASCPNWCHPHKNTTILLFLQISGNMLSVSSRHNVPLMLIK